MARNHWFYKVFVVLEGSAKKHCFSKGLGIVGHTGSAVVSGVYIYIRQRDGSIGKPGLAAMMRVRKSAKSIRGVAKIEECLRTLYSKPKQHLPK